MTVLLDTGTLYAYYDRSDAWHKGANFIADLARDRYARVAELNRRFADLELGFVDAAIVAISESLRVRRIATTDRRDFQPLADALSLQLLP